MSTSTTTYRPVAAAPLLWNRPRLRFLNEAPDGAAPGDFTADSQGEQPDGEQPDGESSGTSDGEQPDPEGVDKLGDAGKKALDTMKAERNAAKNELRDVKAELASLKAQVEGRDAEHQAELKAQELRDEALAKANDRILKHALRAAAAGKLHNPDDALRFLDLSEFEVGDDGDVDTAALDDAIKSLESSHAYLFVGNDDTRRFGGSADGGARKASDRPQQLNREDLKKLTPQQIIAARDAGQLEDLLAPNR